MGSTCLNSRRQLTPVKGSDKLSAKMTIVEPTLLLTRPEPQSNVFLRQCEKILGRTVPYVISPLFQIEILGPAPNLDRFASLIFTSGNGVRSALVSGSLNGRAVFTVGEKTAILAKSSGAEATSLGENVEQFLASADRVKGPALYCRGKHTRGNLAERLIERNIKVEEAILYDQVSRPLTFQAQELLSGDAPVVAPIFSPRTAAILGKTNNIRCPLTIVAMSNAVAEAWPHNNTVFVANSPTSKAMADLTMQQF
jgi:uroporphyrinogen-III synthase